jgi:hypothetical protein
MEFKFLSRTTSLQNMALSRQSLRELCNGVDEWRCFLFLASFISLWQNLTDDKVLDVNKNCFISSWTCFCVLPFKFYSDFIVTNIQYVRHVLFVSDEDLWPLLSLRSIFHGKLWPVIILMCVYSLHCREFDPPFACSPFLSSKRCALFWFEKWDSCG